MVRRFSWTLHYLWFPLLFLAALLAQGVANTITLMVAAVIYAGLVAMREHRLGTIMRDLSDTLSIGDRQQVVHKQITTTTLERTMSKVQRKLLIMTITAELVIFLLTLLTNIDTAVARNYAVLVLVALSPLGLEVELAALLHSKRTRTSETVRTAIDFASEDASTLLCVIGLSLLGTVWLHIPAALSVLEILIITCLARPLMSGRALQSTPHKADQPWRTLFATVTVYGSFLFFFLRHYFSPRYLDTLNPITWRATSVALATFVVCQAALVLYNPTAPREVINKALTLLAALLVIVYLPLTHSFFMTHAISSLDWLCIVIAGLFYVSLCLLQQFTDTHSRRSVIALRKNAANKH